MASSWGQLTFSSLKTKAASHELCGNEHQDIRSLDLSGDSAFAGFNWKDTQLQIIYWLILASILELQPID